MRSAAVNAASAGGRWSTLGACAAPLQEHAPEEADQRARAATQRGPARPDPRPGRAGPDADPADGHDAGLCGYLGRTGAQGQAGPASGAPALFQPAPSPQCTSQNAVEEAVLAQALALLRRVGLPAIVL